MSHIMHKCIKTKERTHKKCSSLYVCAQIWQILEPLLQTSQRLLLFLIGARTLKFHCIDFKRKTNLVAVRLSVAFFKQNRASTTYPIGGGRVINVSSLSYWKCTHFWYSSPSAAYHSEKIGTGIFTFYLTFSFSEPTYYQRRNM